VNWTDPPCKAGGWLITFSLPLFILLSLASCRQGPSSGTLFGTYAEAGDPDPVPDADWQAVRPGLHTSVASIDVRYPKHAVPRLASVNDWKGTAWRGEKVSAQLVLWSKDPIENITCRFSDFIPEQGRALSSGMARARFVRYVLTDEFADGCSRRNPADYPVHLSADALDNAPSFDMEGKTARPVWITLQVPADAAPGIYASTMQLEARGEKTMDFYFQLEVLPRTLPPPSEWKFHLDLWQHPWSIAYTYKVKPWSPEHWEILRPYAKMLADAGQKVITTAVIEKPWGTQTEYGFESMVRWVKKPDGSWDYDYTIFDGYVQFMMDAGVNRQISCYSLIPWTNQLIYFDEAKARNDTVEIKPGSPGFIRMWTPFLKDFSRHLEQKGWHKITVFAMDERDVASMRAMLSMMQEAAPDFGIGLADSHQAFKQFPDKVRDLSVSYTHAMIDKEDLEYRKSKGYPTTYYICCVDEFPNTFTFSPPVDAVYLGWYASAAGFDGLLRWSFTSWNRDPLHDSRFRSWPAGDTYMVYPGDRSSIRYERLVEGIQDYEKIRILRAAFKDENTETARVKLMLLDETLARFNRIGRPDNAENLMQQGKMVLEELSR
jgi:hypothetical protein